MIIIKKIEIATTKPLITNANFTFEKQKIYGLTAPNGSGKSTLLRSLASLIPVKNGTILFTDTENTILSNLQAKKESFYFENSSWLDDNLTGLDYLQLINRLWNADETLISDVIKFWDLSSYITKTIKTYSLGMKQKILLSMYDVSSTNYWLLDEPTLALDKKSVERLSEYLTHAKQQGKMILFSSHAGDEIFNICDEIITIENQHLVLEGGTHGE